MEEVDKLAELSNFFKRMNSKILLIKLLTKAKAEYDKYDFASGRTSLEEAYEVDRHNPAVLRGLGCLELFDKHYEKAVEYYKTALEYSKDKETEYTLIGMAYYLQDKLDEAVEFFNYAIDANENYVKAYEGRNQAMLENHLKIIDLQDSLKKYF